MKRTILVLVLIAAASAVSSWLWPKNRKPPYAVPAGHSAVLYDNPDFSNALASLSEGSVFEPCRVTSKAVEFCAGETRFYLRPSSVRAVVEPGVVWQADVIEDTGSSFAIGFSALSKRHGGEERLHPSVVVMPKDSGSASIFVTPARPGVIFNVESNAGNGSRKISWRSLGMKTIEFEVDAGMRFGIASQWNEAGKLLLTPKSSPKAPFTIMLDPGHGGEEDRGACVSGICEGALALKAAQFLKSELDSDLIRVLLTRDADAALPLEERAAMASRRSADLFIALHFDDWGSGPGLLSGQPVGLSCYYFSPIAREFARSICAAAATGGMRAGTVVQRSLFVLNSHEYPAILLELANLRDQKDLEAVRTDELLKAYLRPLVAPLRRIAEQK